MPLTHRTSFAVLSVLLVLCGCSLVSIAVIKFFHLKTDASTVSDLLGGNLTLSGTLIAVIGLIVTFIPRNKGSARDTMLLLLFSTIAIMILSSLVVFLSYIYLGNEENQEQIEPIITQLFVLLPLVSMVLAAVIPITYIKQNPGKILE